MNRLFRLLTTMIIPEKVSGDTSAGIQKHEGDYVEVEGNDVFIKDSTNTRILTSMSIDFVETKNEFFEEINLKER